MQRKLGHLLAICIVIAALPIGLIVSRTAPVAAATLTSEAVNAHSGLCLGILGGTGQNAPAVQWGCNRHADQIWHGGSCLGSYCQIINNLGQCLGVGGGSTTEGAQVVGWQCLGSNHLDQYWYDNGYFSCNGGYNYVVFINLNSGYNLGVAGNSSQYGARLIQWGAQTFCNNQYWAFIG